MYTYKDIVTGKIRRTKGKFAYWTEPGGLLNVPYAVFQNPCGAVLVPRYLLTAETKAAIAEIEEANRAKEATP
jgi:hypothetical protein